MQQDAQRLTALLGARICHDLISPLGAISNGMELLGMSGHANTPEFDLITDCIASANSKIRFFRVAYGTTGKEAMLSRAEIASIIDNNYMGTRMSVVWHPEEDLPRDAVKGAFLAIQCLETATPYGGSIEITRNGLDWHLEARAEKLKIRPEPWAVLKGEAIASDLEASLVQFGLLRQLTENNNRALTVKHSDERITMTF